MTEQFCDFVARSEVRVGYNDIVPFIVVILLLGNEKLFGLVDLISHIDIRPGLFERKYRGI